MKSSKQRLDHFVNRKNRFKAPSTSAYFSGTKSRNFPIFFKDAPFYKKIDFVFYSANYSRITKIAKSQNRDEKNAGADDALVNFSTLE